jgi:hypothetical protein
MNRSRILGMFALLLALGVLSRVLGSDPQSEKIPKFEKIPLLSHLNAEQISSIGVLTGGTTFSFVRTAVDPWEMLKPQAARVSAERMETFLAQLIKLNAVGRIVAEEVDQDRSVYGLEIPTAFLTIKSAESSEAVSFGKLLKVTGNRYMQVQSSADIFLINDAELSAFLSTVPKLIEERPFIFELSDVNAIISIAPSIKPLRFLRQDAGWQLYHGEIEIPLNESAFIAAVGALAAARADDVFDGVGVEYPLYGLDERAATVQLELGKANTWGESSITARVGRGVNFDFTGDLKAKIEDGFYIKTLAGSAIYRFAKDSFAPWRSPLVSFRGSELLASSARVEKAVGYSHDSIKALPLCDSQTSCEVLTMAFRGLRVESYLEELPVPTVGVGAFSLKVRYGNSERLRTLRIAVLAAASEENIGNPEQKKPEFLTIIEDGITIHARVAAEQIAQLPAIIGRK